jgi:pimeloyl-ACP methyl ester carboxylesterase
MSVTRKPPFAVPGELCRVITLDGFELHGFAAAPARKTRVALLHVHGWDGNFYENRFVHHAARVCARRGVLFVSSNNRGHDYLADVLRIRGRGFDFRQVGGVHERFTESVEDIRAWVGLCRSRGCDRVILQGHSHGGIKVLLYLDRTRDQRVSGLVLLSPSDDLGMIRDRLGKRFPRALALARRLVRAGRERDLMPGWALDYPVSAGTFLDCFSPYSVTTMFNLSRTDRDEFPELGRVRVPVLFAVGTEDEAFTSSPEQYCRDAKACLARSPSVTTAVIRGAPHNYLGREARLARVLDRWLAEVAG